MRFASFILCMAMTSACAQTEPAPAASISVPELARQMEVGDMVFIRVSSLPFRKIAHDTNSWTNHVGIVIEKNNGEPVVAESTFPFSKTTPFSEFVERSQNGRVAVSRLNNAPDALQDAAIKKAALARMGIIYDTGFDLHSKRQFCSRYVYEVLNEATHQKIGKIENLKTLFADNPDADLLFWRIWYFGFIPWQRETVTPASMLNSSLTHIVFDGRVGETYSPCISLTGT